MQERLVNHLHATCAFFIPFVCSITVIFFLFFFSYQWRRKKRGGGGGGGAPVTVEQPIIACFKLGAACFVFALTSTPPPPFFFTAPFLAHSLSCSFSMRFALPASFALLCLALSCLATVYSRTRFTQGYKACCLIGSDMCQQCQAPELELQRRRTFFHSL